MPKHDPDFVRHSAMHDLRNAIRDEMTDPSNPTPDERAALRSVDELIADETENL